MRGEQMQPTNVRRDAWRVVFLCGGARERGGGGELRGGEALPEAFLHVLELYHVSHVAVGRAFC